MNKLERIVQEYDGEELLIADGFDDAVIGIDYSSKRLIYSITACVQILSRDMSEEDALKLAASTWKNGITPVVHYSESKALHENDTKIKPQAHSDYINSLPNTYGVDVDIMVESKMKELTILPHLK